ncbi:MAG: hypothetical protein ACRECP_04290 [Methylocella sp.]
MIYLFINILTVVSLMILGLWLEGIGGKHDLVDELLAPFPLGFGGILFVLLERFPA